MLSVCIPVFNHSFLQLAQALHQQCSNANIPFEIIVADDNSTLNAVIVEAETFKTLPHTVYLRNSDNLGNDQNRNLLAGKAQFEWLLFLDADTMPVDDNFVTHYLNAIIRKPADAYSGGIVYGPLKNPNHILKWKHGKSTEEIKKNLNEDDYLGFRGNNFLIKKNVYLEVPFLKLPQKYGYQDTVFGINLKLNGYTLKLIHNPVEHLGLMDGKTFISKTKEAIAYALYLNQHYPDIASKLKIIRFYRRIKKLGLVETVATLFVRFEDKLYKELTSNQPDLFYFQLFKLGYLCTLQINPSQTD